MAITNSKLLAILEINSTVSLKDNYWGPTAVCYLQCVLIKYVKLAMVGIKILKYSI